MTVGDRVITWEAEALELSSDRESFFYRYLRRVSENGKAVREKRWNETIARDFQ